MMIASLKGFKELKDLRDEAMKSRRRALLSAALAKPHNRLGPPKAMPFAAAARSSSMGHAPVFVFERDDPIIHSEGLLRVTYGELGIPSAGRCAPASKLAPPDEYGQPRTVQR